MSGTGKGVDKSNFTQTCNLLSQFLKDKRSTTTSSPYLTLLPFTATSAKSDTTTTPGTMNLLTNLQDSDDASRQINSTSAMDFLPQFMENPSIKQSNNLRSETQVQVQSQPQLSIFYAGKVLVFDGFPPEKATEVMELATKLGSDIIHFGNCNSNSKSKSSDTPPQTSKLVVLPSNTAHQQSPQQHAPGNDMRYPRRASLLKFLEKRKERVIAKGPYHMNNPIPKNDGSSSGGDPEQHQPSKHFDLNS